MCQRTEVLAVGLILQIVAVLLLCVNVSADEDYDKPPACSRLHITSNGFQPAYSGFYVLLEKSTMHHRPTYRHTICTFYLYYVDKSPLRFWLLGPVYGGPKGHVMAITDAELPYMRMDWLTYDGLKGQWVYDDFEVECLQPESQLLAHWPLDKIHRNSDIGPHDYNLTTFGITFTRTTGVRVDQTDQSLIYLDMTSGSSLNIGGDFSLTLWLYPESAGGILQWVNHNSLFTTSIGLTLMYSGEFLKLRQRYGETEYTVGYPRLSTDEWHHLALTYSAATNTLIVYIDGLKAWDEVLLDLEEDLVKTYLHFGAAVSVNGLTIWSRLGGILACIRIYTGMLDHKSILEIMERCEFHSGVEPVVHWPLDEDSTTSDVISYKHNLTAIGEYQHNQEGLVLSSQGTYLIYRDTRLADGLTLDSDFSLLLWFKSQTDGGLIQWNNRLGDIVFTVGPSLAVISNRLYFFTDFVSSAADLYEIGPVMDNTWHHVALTYDRDRSHAQIYVDGILDWDYNITGLNAAMANRPYIAIGNAYYFNNRNRFTGTIACVMLYNTTLESDVIPSELKMCHGRDLAMKPEAFWPLNHNTTNKDMSMNGLHLTQKGSVLYDDGGVLLVSDPAQSLFLDTVVGSELSLDDDFSVVFWIKAHNDGVLLQWVNLLGDSIEALDTVISLGLSLVIADDRLHLVNGVATAENPPFTVNKAIRRKWYHVALTYHSVVFRARVYIDGEMVWHHVIPDLDDAVTMSYMYIGSGYVNNFEKFSGSMACLQIYNSALNEEEMMRTVHMCDNNLFDDYPVVNWPLNDLTTTVDMTGHGFNLTSIGPVLHDADGMHLDVGNVYQVYLDMTESRLGLNKDFTLMFWVYPESDGGLVQWRNRLGEVPSVGLSLAIIGKQLNFFIEEPTALNLPVLVESTLGEDTWSHVALTFKRDTNTVKIYIDGDRVWEQTISGIPEAIDHRYLYIGAAYAFETFFRITGKLACFEIFKYYMLEENIEDVMESCVSFQVDDYPVVNWPLNDLTTTVDMSGYGFNLTSIGPVLHDADGMHLDVGNVYQVYLDMTESRLGLNKDFALMFWVYPESDGGLVQWRNRLGEVPSVGLSLAIIGKLLNFFIEEPTALNLPFSVESTLGEDTWSHVALTFKRDTNTVKIYIDGDQVWEQTVSGIPEAIDHRYLYIGAAYAFETFFRITGKLACFEIFKYYMLEENIEDVMESCVSFQVEKLPLANWPLNDKTTTADVSGNGFTLTKTGEAPHSALGIHFTAGPNYLVFLDMRSPPVLLLDKDFSIFFWLWRESDGGLLQWSTLLVENPSIGLSMAVLGDQLIIFKEAISITNVPTETGMTLEKFKWLHIALTYRHQFSTVTIYIDGVEEWEQVLEDVLEGVSKPFLYIGRAEIYGSSFGITATMACLKIFNYHMDGNQIEKEAEKCESIDIEIPAIANWPLNVDTTTSDMSGNKFDLISEGTLDHDDEGVILYSDPEQEDSFSLFLADSGESRLRLSQDFSILLWVNYKSEGGLLQWENHLGSTVISVGLSMVILGGRLRIFTGFVTAENQPMTVAYPLVPNHWYHIALVYNRLLSRVEVYVDGQVVDQGSFSNLNTALDKPYLNFGSVYIDGPREMSGRLACVMLFDLMLTEEDIIKKLGKCDNIHKTRLQAYWPLNYNTTTEDVSDNDFHLTSVGSVKHREEGVELDRDEKFSLYLNTSDRPTLGLQHDFSIALWVNLKTDGGLLQWQGSGFPYGLALAVVDRKLHLLNDRAVLNTNQLHTINFPILYKRWYHIALTYHKLSEMIQVYIDGHMRFQKEIPDFYEAVDEPFLYFGAAILQSERTIKVSGTLACVMIYSKMLDMDEVQDTSEMCKSVELDDIVEVAYWPLNNQHRLNDISDHGYDLTAQGVEFIYRDHGVILVPQDGVALFLETTPDEMFHFIDDMSLSVWVYSESDGGIIQFRNGSEESSMLGLSLSNFDSNLAIFKGDVGNSEETFAFIQDQFTKYNWHHITLVYNSHTDNVTVYLNNIHMLDMIFNDFHEAVNMPYLYVGASILRYEVTQVPGQLAGSVACLGLYEGMLTEEDIKDSMDRCNPEEEPEEVILPNPLVNWPFNEVTTTKDVSGNNLDLTVEGVVAHNDEGIILNNIPSNTLYVLTDPLLVLEQNFSMTLWIHAKSNGGIVQWLNKLGSIVISVGLYLAVNDEGKLVLFSPTETTWYTVDADIGNNWHHVAMTYDELTTNVTIYIDGMPLLTRQIPGVKAAVSKTLLYIGRAYFSFNEFTQLTGQLACFMIFAHKLSREQVRKAHDTCDSMRLEKVAIIDWSLNDEHTFADVAGYNHNLTSDGIVEYNANGVYLDRDNEFLLYLNLLGKPDLELERDFSILFWVHPLESGGLFQWLDRFGSTVFRVGLTMLYEGERLVVMKELGGSLHTIDTPVYKSIWHHVTVVYDDAFNNLTVYIDGEPEWHREFPDLTATVAFQYLYLGAAYPIMGVLSRFSGTLACFQVYDRLLEKSDIARIMHTCHHLESGVKTIAYWPLNMIHETRDLSGNEFHLNNTGIVFNDRVGVSLRADSDQILFLDAMSDPRFQLLNDFTLTFWTMCEVDGGFLQWLNPLDVTIPNNVGLSFSHFGGSLMMLEGFTGDPGTIHVIENILNRGGWHHIALVYDDSQDYAILYLDGEAVWSSVIEDLTKTIRKPSFYIGQVALVDGPSLSVSRMTGKLACLGIHSGAFSEEQVERDLGRCFRDEEPALLGFFPINEDTVTSDASGDYTLINTGVEFDALGINVKTSGDEVLYLDLTNGPVFLDGQDLSISVWVYLRSDGGILQWIDHNVLTVEQIGLSLVYKDDALRLYTGAAPSTADMILIDDTIRLNPWHHIVLSYEALSTNLTVYIDNINVFERSVPGLIASTRRKYLYFGVAAEIEGFLLSLTAQRLTGSLACLGLYQGTFTAEEVAQEQKSCVGFHTDPTLLGYWPLNKLHDNDDISGNNHDLLDEGVDYSDSFGVRLNKSTILYLDLDEGTVPAVLKDFSVMFWINVQEQGGLLQWVSPPQESTIILGLSLIFYNNILALYTKTLTLNEIPDVMVPNEWHHLTLTYQAQTDNATIYIDGRSVWTKIMPDLERDTYHEYLYLGAAAVSAGNSIFNSLVKYTGKIACFAIFDGAVHVSKIEEMMHDSRCYLETEAPTKLAFWPLNDQTQDDDTSGNNLHLFNTGVTFSEVGAELTADTDVLFLQMTEQTMFTPTDFSISFYIRPEAPGGILQFASVTGTDVTSIGLSIALEDGLVVLYTATSQTEKFIQSAFLSLLKWQHFLLTYESRTNEVFVYRDGVAVWSGVIPNLYLALQKTVMYIGAAVTTDLLPLQLGWLNRKMAGKMACLGIYDGVFKLAEVPDLMTYCIGPDPRAFWPLNKVAQGNDITGNGYHLVSQGILFDQDLGFQLTDDPTKEVKLDVRDDHLQLGDDFTVTFWIYPETDGGILEFLYDDFFKSVGFAISRSLQALRIYTGSRQILIESLPSEWQHIGVAYKRDQSTLTVYIDGKLVEMDNDTFISNPTQADYLYIGGIPQATLSGWASFEGKIACVVLYGQYLMEDDIEEDLERCSSVIYVIPDAYALWPLNMEYKNFDLSGNDHHLMATSAVHFDNLIGVRLVNATAHMLYHEAPTVQQAGNMTIVFWFYPMEEGGILQWLNIEQGQPSRIWFSIDYIENGLVIFTKDRNDPASRTIIPNILTPRAWNHVALTLTIKSINYELAIYVDGELVHLSDQYILDVTDTSLSHFFIGTTIPDLNATISGWSRLDGKMACLGLFSETLHVAHIKLLLEDCNIEKDAPQAKAFWPLNNVDLRTDTTGNGFVMNSFNVEFNQPVGVYFPDDDTFVVYSQIISGENLILYPDVSITMWIYPEEGGGLLQYLGLNDARNGFDSVGLSILLVPEIPNTISIFLEDEQGSQTTHTFPGSNIVPFSWNHIVVSHEGSTSNTSLYVNGIWRKSITIPNLAISTNKTNLFLGMARVYTNNGEAKLPYQGYLACLGLYDKALQEEHLPVVMDRCKVEPIVEGTTPFIDLEEVFESVGCGGRSCNNRPCLHEGICLNEQPCGFSCLCVDNYQGPLCECPPEFYYHESSQSCIKVVMSVKTEINNGNSYCQSLEQHGHAKLASIQSQAKNNLIKGLIACESHVFRKITTALVGKGQLDCPVLDYYTGVTRDKCEEKTCLAGGNAFHYLEISKRCLIVSCREGSVPTYKGGTNYDVYWLMGYSEVRRESNSFYSSPLVITDIPLQAMRAVIVEIMSLSSTLTPIIKFSGDTDCSITFIFNYTESKLHLVISNGVAELDQFASTDFSRTKFKFDGNYHTYWISWVNGLFEMGTGSNVGINRILYLEDQLYSFSKNYINTLTLSVDTDGIISGFAAEIHTCDGFWTNGRKISGTPALFEWAGESSQALSYNNWARSLIGGTLQDCIYTDSDGEWHQEYCHVKLCLVCEVPVGYPYDAGDITQN